MSPKIDVVFEAVFGSIVDRFPEPRNPENVVLRGSGAYVHKIAVSRKLCKKSSMIDPKRIHINQSKSDRQAYQKKRNQYQPVDQLLIDL